MQKRQKNLIKSVEFVGGFTQLDKCPVPTKPEFAFIGRSNVGKSSLINALLGRKAMARVSKSPGKTSEMNYYLVNGEFYIVDLPGYGFARRSKSQRKVWKKMIDSYLLNRGTLATAFVLLDSRIKAQNNDMEFLQKLGKGRVPFNLVFTKLDKLKPQKAKLSIRGLKDEIGMFFEEIPLAFPSSSKSGQGIEEIRGFIFELSQKLQ